MIFSNLYGYGISKIEFATHTHSLLRILPRAIRKVLIEALLVI